MSQIYVASSWRNQYQQSVVRNLRLAGHAVYDFKNPAPGDKGFHWSEIDSDWKSWSPEEFRKGLDHPIARKGYGRDKGALDWANSSLLVLPSGLSAHGEANWMAALRKPTAIYAPEIKEPELMYLLIEESARHLNADWFCTDMNQVYAFFEAVDRNMGVVGSGHRPEAE